MLDPKILHKRIDVGGGVLLLASLYGSGLHRIYLNFIGVGCGAVLFHVSLLVFLFSV